MIINCLNLVVWRFFSNFEVCYQDSSKVMKSSPEVLPKEEIDHINSHNERDRRILAAFAAKRIGWHGVSIVSKSLGISPHTIRKGKKETDNHIAPPKGRIRNPGGGRKSLLETKFIEWRDKLEKLMALYVAGLPGEGSVRWLVITVTSLIKLMEEAGMRVSRYIVTKMLKIIGLKKRSFIKNLPMRYCKDRDTQFRHIQENLPKALEDSGTVVLSIDTKKKEMIGNFKRGGKVWCQGIPEAFDHDFETFSNGTAVPHGIYDMKENTAYLTIGISHDTSEFVCDNIERVWNRYLSAKYAKAHTMLILCDGGGSNSSRHHIVKQDLMELANRLKMNIQIMHYPPYCSKYNPIEHRVFPHITREWSGAPLLNLKDFGDRAELAHTKKGLKVIVDYNLKRYDTKRNLYHDYETMRQRQSTTGDRLPRLNYASRPTGQIV